jgi:hypothetical protein
MNTKLIGLLGALGSLALSQGSFAQPVFQVAQFDFDRGDLSARQRDRVEEIEDRMNDDLDDVLTSDEQDELENALEDGDDIDNAVDRLDLSDRRDREVRGILRSAEDDLDDALDDRDLRDFEDRRDRRDLPSIYAPGNWQRPNN